MDIPPFKRIKPVLYIFYKSKLKILQLTKIARMCDLSIKEEKDNFMGNCYMFWVLNNKHREPQMVQ